jgi:hypothetical protein
MVTKQLVAVLVTPIIRVLDCPVQRLLRSSQ